ncbi:MAG: protein-L-isoaspartate O-methyltransferase [Spirochaetes bacterium]|nr:protein-L-isoaspartate O-methyltransferase [Spirochaetota bacterium]
MRRIEYYMRTMIATIREYGAIDRRVTDAMVKNPRHLFMPDDVPLETAYGDMPVPIGRSQTISQPSTAAFMLDLLELKPGQNVLEIGTGSGWNAALVKSIVGRSGRVTTLEIDPVLFLEAWRLMERLGIDVDVRCCDGSRGFPEHAPYDRIVVTCAAPRLFEPWIGQLEVGGIIVAPVGVYVQEMIRGIRGRRGLAVETHGSFRFVPMQFSAPE